MDGDRILHGVALQEVLREQVQEALVKEDIDANEELEFYLVNLLHKFHDAEKLFSGDSSDAAEKPLAIMLMEALNESPKVRVQSLKRVGDSALVVAGFFADRVRKTILGLHYYTSMGGFAYAKLSVFCEDYDFSAIYSELSRRFEGFAQVVARVAPWNRAVASNSELVRVYERWLASGDEKLQSLLEREGIRTH